MPETPGATVHVVELVGSSPNSFSDAVRQAVRRASQTIRNITGVDVVRSTADVGDGGEITTYKVTVRVAFVLDQSGD